MYGSAILDGNECIAVSQMSRLNAQVHLKGGCLAREAGSFFQLQQRAFPPSLLDTQGRESPTVSISPSLKYLLSDTLRSVFHRGTSLSACSPYSRFLKNSAAFSE